MSHSDDEKLQRFLGKHQPLAPHAPANELEIIQARVGLANPMAFERRRGTQIKTMVAGVMALAAALALWMSHLSTEIPDLAESTVESDFDVDAVSEWEILLVESGLESEVFWVSDMPAMDAGEEFLALVADGSH